MKQYEMWRIVADRILPRVRRLNGGAYGDRQCESPFARRFVSFGRYDDDIDELFYRDPQFPDSNDRVWNVSSADDDQPPQKAPTMTGCEEIYREAESRLQPEISQLTDTLIRGLPKETSPRYRNAYPSGQRISLPRAMKAEADPRELERIWDRRSTQGRPDPAFVIAADVSGSMKGKRAEATFNAIVIMRESCLRLNVPLGIVIFSDRAWIAQDWSIPRDRNVVPALCRLRGRPRGNTKIARGIEAAARVLSSIPCRNRHLWLISDGNDTRNQHVRKVIREARSVAQTITGLGLGPETDSMKQILPDSIVNLDPEQLPHAVAHLLTTQIRIA
jgi:Mg-chelatase subunit ChlD